ncbi:oxidoreductase [Gracilibacillus boraciitolerans JCM 21714]|uniref:Oxidoreductase n=1 Tax=Gracilibacillus boraciitolerans JCM 21714 TaxID=1298598 RepID=W4VMA0_9BACI|nr:oxidoreductase [Gracilibacillus boraciitolerans JCM 21714]
MHRTVSKDIVYHKEGNPERLAGFSEVTEELLETFEQLKQEGKVKYLASFPMTTAYAKKVVNSGKYQALAGYYNPIETEMASLFPEMKQQGMGYIAIRPLLAGLLTDKRANRDQLPEDSSLRDHSWDDAYQLFDKVKEVVPASEISWESFAIKFCLADPTVTTTVMGLNNPAQVEAAVKAANGVYPDAELVQQVWNTIAKHRKERNTWPPY